MNGVVLVAKADRAHIARMESEMGLVVTEPDFLPFAGVPEGLDMRPGAVWLVESHNYVQVFPKVNWLEDEPLSEGEC